MPGEQLTNSAPTAIGGSTALLSPPRATEQQASTFMLRRGAPCTLTSASE